ncbi:Phosphatidylinositol 3,4,5-trisphosphate 3-phosphatase and dual-specificity protein phosphatase PTEN [Armadillidium vulgare]|nr:Phosphatidylinositol 3,4,5-trisphosphate 3-phosphatase and dual-specificity protein phosphatase PTEN [Armadillidium vulgare]
MPISLLCLINDIMNKGIKGLVSKQKRRYQEGGYDLDLTYITDRIIAMGFPAQKLEGVYRNHIDDVQRFLEEKHKDHYKIYNLCCERSYDESRFHNRVRRFYFADHNPPPLNEIQPMCDDISKWLNLDKKNVAVVHCKAGKGRTGVMICCFMIHSKIKLTSKDALDFYDDKRTHDRKGVTIPSQRRYVEYYAKLVSNGFKYKPYFVRLKEVRMPSPIYNMNSDILFPELYVTVSSHGHESYNSQMSELKKGLDTIVLKVREHEAAPIKGDVKIELKRTNIVRRNEKIFSVWLNTHFIYEEGKKLTNGVEPLLLYTNKNSNKKSIRQSVCSSSSSNSGSIDTSLGTEFEVVTLLTKDQLDKANKDVHHKLLPKDFKVKEKRKPKVELHWLMSYGGDEEERRNMTLTFSSTGTLMMKVVQPADQTTTVSENIKEEEISESLICTKLLSMTKWYMVLLSSESVLIDWRNW